MILSIDTGLNNFGISVIGLDGAIHYMDVIRTKKETKKGTSVASDYTRRLAYITTELKKVIVEYPLTIITAEMPSFGAQSFDAIVSLTAGATIVISLSSFHNLPLVYTSPGDVKESFTGDRNASKKKIMAKCCKMYGWDITYKSIKDKRVPGGIRKDPIYHVMGKKLGAGYFEHIADSIAVFHTCKKLKQFKEITNGN